MPNVIYEELSKKTFVTVCFCTYFLALPSRWLRDQADAIFLKYRSIRRQGGKPDQKKSYFSWRNLDFNFRKLEIFLGLKDLLGVSLIASIRETPSKSFSRGGKSNTATFWWGFLRAPLMDFALIWFKMTARTSSFQRYQNHQNRTSRKKKWHAKEFINPPSWRDFNNPVHIM